MFRQLGRSGIMNAEEISKIDMCVYFFSKEEWDELFHKLRFRAKVLEFKID